MAHEDFRYLDLEGARIGKYRFIRKLGSGGFASVWLADDAGANSMGGDPLRQVAIKVFVADFENRAAFRAMLDTFDKDTRPLIALASNNEIVRYHTHDTYEIVVFDDGTAASYSADSPTDGRRLEAIFVVMEYADGGSLESKHHPDGTTDNSVYRAERILSSDKNEFLEHFVDICHALQAAHDQHLVHCDIKPANLLYFKNSNKVKIGDFGVASTLQRQTFGVCGTPLYMAPECFDPSAPKAPSRDVYALGCTLFELCSGRLAVALPGGHGTTATEDRDTFDAIHSFHARAPRPDTIVHAPRGKISVSLSAMIKRMMAIRAEDRPKLSEVVDVLQAERRAPLDFAGSIVRAASVMELPATPTLVTPINVNPRFRFDRLNELLYLVYIQMPVRTEMKVRLLYWFLESYFKDRYSFYETYGNADFIVRVWSTPQRGRVSLFCEFVRDEILEGDPSLIRVSAYDDVIYVGRGADSSFRENVDTREALARLYDVYRGGDSDAMGWLRRNKLVVREKGDSFKAGKVKCFCRVIPRGNERTAAARQTHFFLLATVVRQTNRVDVNKLDMSLYKKSGTAVGEIQDDEATVIIKYVAPSYEQAAIIPGLILEDLEGNAFRTSTLLVTKRHFIESDMVGAD